MLISFACISYTIIYLYFSKNKNTAAISGYLSLSGQAGLDAIAIILCFIALKKTIGNFRLIYQLLLASFVCAFLADGIYNLLLNIEQLPKINNIQESLFDIPFTKFLIVSYHPTSCDLFAGSRSEVSIGFSWIPRTSRGTSGGRCRTSGGRTGRRGQMI